MVNWSDDDSDSSTQDKKTLNYLAFNVVTDAIQKLVEHLPADLSDDKEFEVTEEDIIKNYSLLNEKWVMVVENNKKLSQNVSDLKIEKIALEL